MTQTSTPAAPISPRLAALQSFDRHVIACTDRTAGAMPLDDGHQPTVVDTCPEADRLWAAVLGTPA